MAWIRLYDDLLDDRKLARVARDTGRSLLEVRGAWISLLLLASQSPVRGCLMLDSNTALSIEDVSETFHETFHETGGETATMLQAFRDRDMIGDDEHGIPYIMNWDKRQFESDLSTDRVKKHREKKRFSNVSETPPEQNRTEQNRTEQNRTEQNRREACASPLSFPFSVSDISGPGILRVPLVKAYLDTFCLTAIPANQRKKLDPELAEISAHRFYNVAVGTYEQCCRCMNKWREDHAEDKGIKPLLYILRWIRSEMDSRLKECDD